MTSVGATTCICCLDQTGPFINLLTCTHTEFICSSCDFVPNTPNMNQAICIICHRMLDKIHMFRIQVKESVQRLAQQIPTLAPNKLINNLQISNAQSTNTLTINYDTQEDIKPEPIKTESDHETDFSNDDMCLPLSEIKKEISKKNKSIHGKIEKKSCKGKKNPQTTKFEEKYKGKIRLVSLSATELQVERTSSRLKSTYQKLPFKCDDCIKGFDHDSVLQQHIDRQHTYKESSLQCDICKCYLTSEPSLTEHRRRHFKRYECVRCTKRYVTLPPVILHYNESHASSDDVIPTQYVCQQCGDSFPTHRSYRYHCEKHKGKEQCTECGNTFVNRQVLKSHMLTVHLTLPRVFTCLDCGATYKAKSGLAAHAAVHKPPQAFHCTQCQVTYRSAAVLKHHLKTHSRHRNDRLYKFSCEQCARKFPSRPSLDDHVNWDHLSTSAHKCTACDKVFKHASGLRKHKRSVHDKLRPPRDKICHYCARAFCTLQILRAHLRTHTGERPLRCALCHATFAHTASLYTHNKLVHKTGREATHNTS